MVPHCPDNDGSAVVRYLKSVCAGAVAGRPVGFQEQLLALRKFAQAGLLVSLEPLLPLFLTLKGKPYTLEEHFPFAPIFRLDLPAVLTLKTGRQSSKSTSIAASGILFANVVPHVTLLYITPLFEQVRRFSANYVRPFIDTSPVKALWSDSSTENSVLQRSFRNQSKMIFSFALDSADRIRGITSDMISLDEAQDVDPVNVPVIVETMSFSDWKLFRSTGTPKTFDNYLQATWDQSSQAEWFVPCFRCTTDGRPTQNIPAIEHHLDAMIGPASDDIGPDRPGTICHKCRRPIDPKHGRWVHRYPARLTGDDPEAPAGGHAGYHVPQIILPHHYAHADAWKELTNKQRFFPTNVFYNEVLGESYDVGSKLITETDLKAAATLPWENDWRDPDGITPAGRLALEAARGASFRALGVDWGGGGKEGVSYTTLALVCWSPGGKLSVVWGKRLQTPHDHIAEADEVARWVAAFGPGLIAHDYTGAGALRETILLQRGLPPSMLMPVSYMRSASGAYLRHVPASPLHPRDHWQADKTRSLLYTCAAIRTRQVEFFKYDYRSEQSPGLMRDFLALVDEKTETPTSSGVYIVRRQANRSDDFAHAVNLGALACWHATDSLPDFARSSGMPPLRPDQLRAALGCVPEDPSGYFYG